MGFQKTSKDKHHLQKGKGNSQVIINILSCLIISSTSFLLIHIKQVPRGK